MPLSYSESQIYFDVYNIIISENREITTCKVNLCVNNGSKK